MTTQTLRPPSRRRRLTIRARLCASYAGLVTVCGIVFIALLYLYMRYVPTYDLQIRQATELDPTMVPNPTDDAAGLQPTQPAQPLEIRTADDVLNNILIASVIALGILIVLGAAIGWVMAGRIIKPIAAINTAAKRASSGSLDHRINMDGPHDEVRDLSETFDHMLSSLERSFQAQRRFTANASHELRSPLTTVKTMIDVTLADPDADAHELRGLAERIRDVNQSHIDTVEALLDLASASTARHVREPVNLAEIVTDTLRSHEHQSRERGLTITTGISDAWIHANPILLGQAVSNLIRNAIHHNHPNGHITVTTAPDPAPDAGALITVTNTGPLVPTDTIEHLTEPFVRGEGRTVARGKGHGHGLGLAIVRAIIDAHDGELTLTPGREGGLTAQIRIPTTRRDPDSRHDVIVGGRIGGVDVDELEGTAANR